ncbi:hypothetical protein RhiirA1_446717 [Rhizophagus irregularis]|uniref:Zinc finger bed domain-containing protein 1-like n=1 Tax=Rhizophagus irregularis TaxID=588596 RepID=A0A2N0QXS9_9GLOM|nr:hypothetical protein RhiirA1_446717 [Rhizophagus irregularis]
MADEFDYIHIEDDDNNNIRNSLADKGVDKETDTGFLISLRSSESGSQKSQGINKRKKQSFTKQYFEKGFNIKGEETRICTVLNKDGNRCGQVYRNTGSSAGNLIAHLRDIHQIIDEDNHDGENNYKRKQIERLEEVQRKLKYEDVMRCVQDVQTRWNSSFYAWDRLFYLKDAIIQLQADLYTSTSREDKNDGIKLRKILLSEDEWDLLDKLVDVLLPFEEATREFSGGTYVTLSKMIPCINELIFNLAPLDNTNDNDIDYYNEDTVFEEDILDVENDNEEIISNITKKKISIKDPLNTEGAIEKVKNNIYNALLYYWNIHHDAGLMASLLDPRYKEMDFVLDDEKEKIIRKLCDEFNEMESNNSTPHSPAVEPSNVTMPSSDAESSLRSQKGYRQRRQTKSKKDKSLAATDKVSNYLAMPVALEEENPLDWWRIQNLLTNG